MAINLEASFSTVVHSSPPPPHDLQAAFVTVVHTDVGAVATIDPGFLPRFLSGFFDGVKFE